MERLLTLDDFSEPRKGILGGYARALSTIVRGHVSHDDVHERMMKKDHIAAAIAAIIRAVEDSIESGGRTFIYHDQGFSEKAGIAIDDWLPDDVLFRLRPDGLCDLVFIDPFREGLVFNEDQRAQLRQDVGELKARFDKLTAPDVRPAKPVCAP